ncbi:hypothetical protein Fmac_000921 [Flemingia macrophylla]|uniref:Uncharacterized protein n=1 Tax=Flemingia macrophylla TaxID=520843 RepID=A0ABD1NG46_9FABA
MFVFFFFSSDFADLGVEFEGNMAAASASLAGAFAMDLLWSLVTGFSSVLLRVLGKGSLVLKKKDFRLLLT